MTKGTDPLLAKVAVQKTGAHCGTRRTDRAGSLGRAHHLVSHKRGEHLSWTSRSPQRASGDVGFTKKPLLASDRANRVARGHSEADSATWQGQFQGQ